MKETAEQEKAVAIALRGESMKISAFAGAGKTTTLKLVARALAPRRGLYLAFNKAIQVDAASKMPSNVECRTFHSLAFKEFGRKFNQRLALRFNGGVVADALKIEDLRSPGQDSIYVSRAAIGTLLIDSVKYFCRSIDSEIGLKHIAAPKIINAPAEQIEWFRLQLINYARELWRKMSDENSSFPSAHDVYVKLWAMSDPKISADFILFDEAQDADSVMLHVVQKQDSQIIWVGDTHQSIYSWRGAVNAMQNIATKQDCSLTMSFRFGQRIADYANKTLAHLGESRLIIGNPQVSSKVGFVSSPSAILCRTNAGVVSQLMRVLASPSGQNSVIACTGTEEALSFFENAIALQENKKASGAFVLFKDWSELVEYSKTDQGSDLKTYVQLENNYGAKTILNTLKRVKNAATCQDADITISTAHKAKGLEWDSVCLGSDFKIPGGIKPATDEEIRLFYVAMTRAKTQLDLTNVDGIKDFEASVKSVSQAPAVSPAVEAVAVPAPGRAPRRSSGRVAAPAPALAPAPVPVPVPVTVPAPAPARLSYEEVIKRALAAIAISKAME